MNDAINRFEAMHNGAAYKQPPRKKNVGVAVLLALLFGPLGMFYISGAGAVIMLSANIVLYALRVPAGFFITGPVCVLWAAMAASAHNERAHLAREGGAVSQCS